MCAEARVSLTACAIGAAIPVACLGSNGIDRVGAIFLFGGATVLPFAVVAATAWATRTDRRASRVVAVVAVVDLLIAVGGWVAAAQDEEGFALGLAALLFVPTAQLGAWLVGAVVSGRRRRARCSPQPTPGD